MAEITLVQINDSHAYLYEHPEAFAGAGGTVYRNAGGYARIATLLSRWRRTAPVLFLDCGDTLHGTWPAVATHGALLPPLLNRLGIAAMTGHWEFAYGPKGFQDRARALDYPVLACNVYDERSGASLFSPCEVFEVGNCRVGVIGVASNIVDKTMPASFSEGAFFTLGLEVIGPLAARLRRDDKVDLVVLLSHLGLPQDLKLLGMASGIDVCLSGHTHNRLFAPMRAGGALVIQSGAQGSFLGRLDLSVEGGRIRDYRHELVCVAAGIVPDAAMADAVSEALRPYREERDAVQAEAAGGFDRFAMWESTADNLLLAAIRAKTGVPLAFTNAWRYGAPIPAGPVTRGALRDWVPMNPPVSAVTLTGAELRTLLEQNLERTFAADPFSQMGGYVKRALGLRAYVKLENPSGSRLAALFVGDEPVRDEARYEACFLTEQAIPAGVGENRQALGLGAGDVLCEYAGSRRVLRPEIHGTYTLI
ncbi:bifunctional metallophosphatase/5'-nucleotidase [Acidiferrobacter thiooxydans]|uniref:Bifunctional metallophosphatase/5'-nucleotidase n=1 Tax=Acidiferrobacter thiooxydans TaxID=163359 RepID=A0A368HH07_9GAMM|nr:bifunctional metallophosphatase/5'-nucleotidase [Acidiferrobacter thiooxydans]RCN58636.1 bifunctional metallophosphatase/5'-nucleotidase [Acidiferrobacter thiooxydans]